MIHSGRVLSLRRLCLSTLVARGLLETAPSQAISSLISSQAAVASSSEWNIAITDAFGTSRLALTRRPRRSTFASSPVARRWQTWHLFTTTLLGSTAFLPMPRGLPLGDLILECSPLSFAQSIQTASIARLHHQRQFVASWT